MRWPKTAALVVAGAFALAADLARSAEPARTDGTVPALVRTTLHVEGMTCPSCKAAVRTAITRLQGVKQASVDVAKKSATVEYDASRVSPQQIADAVNRLGYEATVLTNGGG
jgi:copper ion binding protein